MVGDVVVEEGDQRDERRSFSSLRVPGRSPRVPFVLGTNRAPEARDGAVRLGSAMKSRFRRAPIRASGADLNTGQVVAAFLKFGASVVITTGLGGGFPDLVVGYRGVTHLVEVKRQAVRGRVSPSAVKLRKSQEQFIRTWCGRVPVVVRSAEEAMAWVRTWRAEGASTVAPMGTPLSAVEAWEADRARRGPPPEVLVDARQDTLHQEPTELRGARRIGRNGGGT